MAPIHVEVNVFRGLIDRFQRSPPGGERRTARPQIRWSGGPEQRIPWIRQWSSRIGSVPIGAGVGGCRCRISRGHVLGDVGLVEREEPSRNASLRQLHGFSPHRSLSSLLVPKNTHNNLKLIVAKLWECRIFTYYYSHLQQTQD